MGVTLAMLLRDEHLRLTLRCGGEDALNRPLSGVHTSELADPGRYLDGGELLLTTGLALRRSPSGWDAFAESLARADSAAIGFGVGLSHQSTPEALIEAGETHGLAVVEVPKQVPFLAISKAVFNALAEDQVDSLRALNSAQQKLAQTVSAADPVGALTRCLARLIDGWACVTDPAGQPMRSAGGDAARFHGAVAEAVTAIGAAGHRASVVLAVAGFQVWAQSLGEPADAVLVVATARTLTPAERSVVNMAACLAVTAMRAHPDSTGAQRGLRGAVLTLLRTGLLAQAEDIANAMWGPLPPAPVAVLVVAGNSVADGAAEDVIASWSSATRSAVFYAQSDGQLIVLTSPAGAADLAGRLIRRLAGVRVGISATLPAGAVEEGIEQAHAALDVVSAGPRRSARYADVAGLGLRAVLPAGAAERYANELLAPIARHDHGARGDLIRSLRSWLAHHGQWEAAANELGVHRHTLRNRIVKVEQLTGLNLDNPGARSELWLALQWSHNGLAASACGPAQANAGIRGGGVRRDPVISNAAASDSNAVSS